MRVLLIKTSSMGDLIHTLPALTDAGNAIPGIQFDWVVEDSFAEIPEWHPLVKRVIPVSLRRWRKRWLSAETYQALRALRTTFQEEKYDLVLDAQGLIKSGLLALLAKGPRAGLDFHSARESFSSFAYQQKHTVNFKQHAVVRMRSLFSQALHYPLPNTPPAFGVDRKRFTPAAETNPYLVFLHGTTWASKQYPESYWQALARMAAEQGYRVKISGGNDDELARAARIGANNAAVDLLPRLTIRQMADLLAGARAAVAVDTGFGHLSAAMDVPTVSIYGSTNADYTGALGPSSVLLSANFPCAPCLNRDCNYRKPADVTPACYGTVPPALVFKTLFSI